MSKDFPALRMTVEGGRLVPATPFDAERINSYRNRSLVLVKLAPPKDRVQIRKWFAILGLVMKQCKTPWDNVDQAHEAIKLALGIVDLSKTITGQFMAVPKSLTELDDPELDEAVLQMIDLLSRLTGVDVATLRKEAADVGQAIADEEQAKTDDADRPAASEEVEAGSIPASPASASSSLINHLTDFARKGFRTLSDEDLTDNEKAAGLEDMTGTYEGLLETGEISKDDWPKFESIVTAFKAVFAGKRTVDQGREFAAEVIGCKVSAIGGVQ